MIQLENAFVSEFVGIAITLCPSLIFLFIICVLIFALALCRAAAVGDAPYDVDNLEAS